MGMQKRLRAAQRNNYALETGERPFSKTPLGAGQLRARARLMEQRKANYLRLNGPKQPMMVQISEMARASMEAVGEAVSAFAEAVADKTGVTEAMVEKPKRVRKPKAEVAAVIADAEPVLEKKPRKVGVRKAATEGV